MPYHTLDSLMEDPHLAEVGFFETLEHPTEGKIRNMRLPNKTSFSARAQWQGAVWPTRAPWAAPARGLPAQGFRAGQESGTA